MSKKSWRPRSTLRRNSRSFSTRPSISWIATQNWLDPWEKCIAMDKLAQQDHSYCPTSEEYERYKKNWYISLNKSGRNAPMKQRSDFREAVTIMNRLHRESGEERPEPIPVYQYQRVAFVFFFQYFMVAVEWKQVPLVPLWSEICMDIHLRDYFGKGNLEKFCRNTDGRKFLIGRVSWKPVNQQVCVWKNLYRIIMRTI